MLTPSEIALLQQDLKAALSVVEKDEIDDARTLLAEHGFSNDDFECSQLADPSPLQPSAITGKIIWTRKSNATAQEYVAGHGSKWLMLFDEDLKSRVFGSPATTG